MLKPKNVKIVVSLLLTHVRSAAMENKALSGPRDSLDPPLTIKY